VEYHRLYRVGDPKTTNVDDIKKALQKVFNKRELKKFEKETSKLIKNVYDRANSLSEEIGGCGLFNVFRDSDDGWSDATNHIVGLGKKSYDEFMEHPLIYVSKKTEKHKTKFWYIKNFSYIFQFD
jgi:hypothetical protein